MSTTVQLKPEASQTPYSTPQGGTALPHKEDVVCSNEENNHQTINNVESLKNGILHALKNKTKGPCTILLVGQPGVGKSSFLQLIANVLTGRDIDHFAFDILDHTNEQRLSNNNRTQTISARLYQIKTTNGVVVRILDTPGLVNTLRVEQDELHNKSITNQIKAHIESVTAVLILANGTVPSNIIDIDHTLSTLSSIFPKTFTKNIAFMCTNVSSPLYWNFCEGTIPPILVDAPRFQIDNPFALQKKYLDLKSVQDMKGRRMEFRKAVKAAEQNALETIVGLFDWLDGLEPQPTMKAPPNAQQAPEEAKHPALIHVSASKLKPTYNPRFVGVLVIISIPWIQLLCSILAPYLSRAESKGFRG